MGISHHRGWNSGGSYHDAPPLSMRSMSESKGASGARPPRSAKSKPTSATAALGSLRSVRHDVKPHAHLVLHLQRAEHGRERRETELALLEGEVAGGGHGLAAALVAHRDAKRVR